MTEKSRRYHVVIPSRPVPKERPRFTKQGRTYTPPKTMAYENWVRLCCTQAVGTPCVPGPVAVRVLVVLPPPRGMKRADVADAMAGRKLHTTRGDLDNQVKAISDALNGVAWRDDAAIASIRAVKRYGHETRAEVWWWQMAPEECQAELAALEPAEEASTGPEALL